MLDGKVILITGGSRGLGKALAKAFAAEGARAVIAARSAETLEAARREIEASGGTVLALAADMTQQQDIARVVEATIARFGRIDVLINNLGDAIMKPLVALPQTRTRTIDDEALQRILDLNAMATLRCTRAVGPHFLARRSGKVINIASYTVAHGGARVVLYTAAKAAVVGFTQAQALEWAPYNIQVNAIAPGLFPDPRSQGAEVAQNADQIVARVAPLGRAGRLREVGLLALYLASAASDYMTGQTLYLDGGASIR